MTISRRDFVLIAAAAAAMPAASQETAKPSPEAEARMQMILARYGSRLTEEQKADIRRLITSAQGGFDTLRAYPLDNATEPATVFRVYANPRKPRRITTHK